MYKVAVFTISSLLVLSLSVSAQESRSELSIQGTALFTKSTSGNSIPYSAKESGGFLGAYRHHVNKRIAIEAAYGYSLNTQKYIVSPDTLRVQSRIHQFAGSMILNLRSFSSARITPYLLVGGGAVVFAPTNNLTNSLFDINSQAKGVFVYGAGADYTLTRAIAFRLEYRGLIYSPPDFGFGRLVTNSLTHTAMPSVGITFRF